MKLCTRCQTEKEDQEFHRNASHNDGLSSWCKTCNNQRSNWAQKKWYQENREYCLQRAKLYHQNYYPLKKETIKARTKRYYLDNPGRLQQWKEDNREHVRTYNRDYNKNQYYNNPEHRLRILIRTRIRRALQGKTRPESALKALGCTAQELVKYIEGLFQPGMSWANQGEWHVDHIRPLSAFNLESPEEFKQACHYTNLRPLWAKENLKKNRFQK